VSRRPQPEYIGFSRTDIAALIPLVATALAEGGWINVQADPEQLDPRAVRRPSLFSGRGRPAPLATIVVGSSGGDHQIGFEHGAGRRAHELLRDAGLQLPPGSRVLSDHARRGIVVSVPATTPAAALAELLVRGASALTIIPLGDDWIAERYPG